MENNKMRTDETIMKLLNELAENKVIDVKTVKTQLDRQYSFKYNYKPKINIKCFDDNVMVYGIVFKQNEAKPIRYDYRVFEYLNANKTNILKWIANYQFYEITEELSQEVSSFDIFKLNVNNYNNKYLIININANDIKTFEHEEIQPYYIRVNHFKRLIQNIDKICEMVKDEKK